MQDQEVPEATEPQIQLLLLIQEELLLLVVAEAILGMALLKIQAVLEAQAAEVPEDLLDQQQILKERMALAAVAAEEQHLLFLLE